jgi:hypothetical protein
MNTFRKPRVSVGLRFQNMLNFYTLYIMARKFRSEHLGIICLTLTAGRYMAFLPTYNYRVKRD